MGATASALGAHARGKLHVPIYIMGDGKGSDGTFVTKAYLWLSGLLASQLSMSGKEIGSIVNFNKPRFHPDGGDTGRREDATSPHSVVNWPRFPSFKAFIGEPTDCGGPCNSRLARLRVSVDPHARVEDF